MLGRDQNYPLYFPLHYDLFTLDTREHGFICSERNAMYILGILTLHFVFKCTDRFGVCFLELLGGLGIVIVSSCKSRTCNLICY